MTKRLLILLAIMLIGGGGYIAHAQDITVKGKVTDAGGETIIGGNIVLKGTATGVATDIDGNYSISAPRNGVLEFSYVGYVTQEIRINGRTTIDVVLLTDEQELEEVVVIGYGTQARRSVTASIASVNGDALKDLPTPNAEAALQGRAAGVSITTPNGGVGQAPLVRVRGVSSITSGTEPLYVVDGIPIQSSNVSSGQTNPLADINPADILSMDVLKDAAAAALYGSRAANGVVLITTRKGQAERARVTYNGWIGVTQPTRLIDVVNAQQYVDLKNLAAKNRYGTDEYQISGAPAAEVVNLLPALGEGRKAFNMWPLSNGGYVDTKWSDYIYQTGLQHSHSVAVSGGSQRTQYYMSANYTDQDGMVAIDAFDRMGAAMNVTTKATEWLKLGANVNASVTNTTMSDNGRGAGNIFATQGFARMAMIVPPNYPAYNEDGSVWLSGIQGVGNGANTANVGTYPNPVALIDLGTKNTSNVARIISSFFGEITPFKGLTLKTQYGLDYMTAGYESFSTPFMGDAFNTNGSATNTRAKNTVATWTNTAQYVFTIGEHNFNALVGHESYERITTRWGANRTNILDTKFNVYQADFNSITASGNTITERALESYLGRLNWDYADKYMAQINIRSDGFSALSASHRWGTFYGFSGAWRLSNENFFEPYSKLFTDLKIKGSWGIVGNTDVDAYAAQSYYSSGFYGSSSYLTLGGIADWANLQWETSTKMDIGFSAQIRRNINIEFDWYRNLASDLILDQPITPSKGIPDNKVTTNAGKMSNTGIELTISATPYKTKDFSWYTSFNIATQKNKVIQLAEGVDELLSTSSYWQNNITVPGYSIGQLYLWETRGIDPETGERIIVATVDGQEVEALIHFTGSASYVRRDGQGTVSEDQIQRKMFGGTLPTYYGGWTNEFKYKEFDLSVLLQYSGGNNIFNGTIATLSDMRAWSNSVEVYNEVWRNPGDNAKYAKPIYGDNYSNGSYVGISDWIEKGDYLRLKNITLGYTFNTKNWSKKVGISSLRLYAMGTNLFCLTGYSGIDPEITMLEGTSGTGLYGGIDKNTQPLAKVFTFGMNVVF
ncbi:MAG: TonB-dependent receptor [Tannerella sp.]|nr:TonB-dependent receptor [Tannerella sp.]